MLKEQQVIEGVEDLKQRQRNGKGKTRKKEKNCQKKGQ